MALLTIFGGCAHEKVTCGDRVAFPTEPRFRIFVKECAETVDAVPTPKASSFYVFRYPSEMLKSHIVGAAEVYARVEADGTVSSARAIKGDKAEFLSAAMDGISRSLFFPATKEGKAVACQIRCEVAFDLEYTNE